MTKENLNRIGFDTRSQEFTITLADDSKVSRISNEDFISEESQKYKTFDFLYFFLDVMNNRFPDLINNSKKLFISEVAMHEIRSLSTINMLKFY